MQWERTESGDYRGYQGEGLDRHCVVWIAKMSGFPDPVWMLYRVTEKRHIPWGPMIPTLEGAKHLGSLWASWQA